MPCCWRWAFPAGRISAPHWLSTAPGQVAVLANQAANYLVSGRAPDRLGNAHPNIVPYQAFAATDGHLILAVGNDAQFARFCQVAGRPELAADPRFASNPKRVENRSLLIPILQELFGARSCDEWLSALEAVKVPCGPINSIDAVFDDPQVKARGMRIDPIDSAGAQAAGVACPIRYSATPLTYELGPPALGEHSEEILREELDISPEGIDALRKLGVI